jgi:hypothetical protein
MKKTTCAGEQHDDNQIEKADCAEIQVEPVAGQSKQRHGKGANQTQCAYTPTDPASKDSPHTHSYHPMLRKCELAAAIENSAGTPNLSCSAAMRNFGADNLTPD